MFGRKRIKKHWIRQLKKAGVGKDRFWLASVLAKGGHIVDLLDALESRGIEYKWGKVEHTCPTDGSEARWLYVPGLGIKFLDTCCGIEEVTPIQYRCPSCGCITTGRFYGRGYPTCDHCDSDTLVEVQCPPKWEDNLHKMRRGKDLRRILRGGEIVSFFVGPYSAKIFVRSREDGNVYRIVIETEGLDYIGISF